MDGLERMITGLVLRDRPILAYGVAALLSVAALGFRIVFVPSEAIAPYLSFFPAVFLACAIGGTGPAILSGLLSILFGDRFLLGGLRGVPVGADLIWSHLGFAVACVVGCTPIELLHHSVKAQKAALAALGASEERFALATRAAFGMIYEWDVRTNTVFRSDGMRELVGLPPDAIGPTVEAWGALTHPDDLERVIEVWSRFLASGGDHLQTVYRVRHADGHWVHVWDRSYVIRAPDGRALRIFGTSVDVTGRIEVEEKLTAALEHRDALIREVHHRVKNSLQTVSSLLNVQSTRLEDPSAKLAFEEAVGRIQAIATVHQALYRDGDLTRVHLDHHVQELCRQIAAANGGGPGTRIACHVHADRAVVSPDDLVPLALIVNELISNAIKHAFPGDAGGTVTVRFERVAGPEGPGLRLEVADDGVGLPVGFDPLAGDSLGMKLVHLLADQLDGRVVIEPNRPRGTRFRIDLPAQACLMVADPAADAAPCEEAPPAGAAAWDRGMAADADKRTRIEAA